MSDNFIEEIKEEIRNDQIQRIWRDYGQMIIGTIIAIILATAGYVAWHSYQEAKLRDQTIAFETILTQKETHQDVTAALSAVQDESSKGYQLLSSFLLAEQKSVTEAFKDLEDLSNQTAYKSFYRDLAHLQAIMRKFDDTNGKEILDDLAPVVDKPSVVQAQALEIQGYAYLKLKAYEQALESFRRVADHPHATQSLIVRARAMIEQMSASYS